MLQLYKHHYFAEPTTISHMVNTTILTEISESIKDTKDNGTIKDFYQISNISISGNGTRQGNRKCPTGILKSVLKDYFWFSELSIRFQSKCRHFYL